MAHFFYYRTVHRAFDDKLLRTPSLVPVEAKLVPVCNDKLAVDLFDLAQPQVPRHNVVRVLEVALQQVLVVGVSLATDGKSTVAHDLHRGRPTRS